MKKILLLILALVLCLGVMTACFEEDTNGDTPAGDNTDDNNGGNTDGGNDAADGLQSAIDFLWDMYREKYDRKEVADSFTVVGSVTVGDVSYGVEWTVDDARVTITENDDGTYTVVIPEASEAIPVVLTATVKDSSGASKSKSFGFTIPKFAVLSFDEYFAAATGDTVIVEGIVASINSKDATNTRNHLFLVDESGKGGYYAYNLAVDPVADLGIEVGMKVRLTGQMKKYGESDTFIGMPEIMDATAKVISTTKADVSAIDVTSVYADMNALAAYTGALVTVKGVTLGGQKLGGSSDYLYFSIAGVESYVRSYLTDLPVGLKSDANKAAIEADHLAHFGYTADVTGILIFYGSTPYIIPVSAAPFTNYVEVEKTPAEKIEAEAGAIEFESTITADTVINVNVVGRYYEDVTLAWSSNNDAVVYADGKLTITVPDGETTVTITVVISCEGADDVTKTFDIKLSKKAISAGAANEIIAGVTLDSAGTGYADGKYLVAGVIVEFANTDYGNCYIIDESGNKLYVYGIYSADGADKYSKLENKPQVGDYVVLLGELGKFKNTAQLKSGWLQEYVPASSIKDAADAGAAQTGSAYTDEKYLVKGEITEVKNATYGNVYIKDAEGNTIYIYGMYDLAGTRYDKLAYLPTVGDTIVVISTAGQYNGEAQLKNAILLVVEKAASGEEGGEGGGSTTDPVDPPAGGDDVVLGDVLALTVDSLGIASSAYESKSVVVGGVGFEFIQLGNYGNGIQMRDKDGNTSSLWNTVAFTKGIKEIQLVFNSAKSTYDNANAVIFTFGNDVKGAAYSTKLSTVAGTKTYTITPDVDTYTFFYLEHDISYSFYWDSITIVFADGSSVTPPAGGEGGEPEHTHNFVEGKCECGESDPNYVAPEEPGDEPSDSEKKWVVATELKNGDLVLIGAASYGKLLSTVKVATYYNKGVDYSATDFSNVTDDEIFVVTVNDDGSYTFTSLSGKVIALSDDTYTSLNEAGVNKSWTLEAKGENTFLVKNTVRNNYLEWYNSKGNWSTYSNASDAQFEMTFYVQSTGASEEPSEPGTPETPDEPEHTHNFVEGKCECGESDPNYVAPGEGEGGEGEGDVAVNKADFETMGNPNASYLERTSASGWVAKNAALNSGNDTATDSNPKLGALFGTDTTMRAVTLNGKTSAVGSLTSPLLSNGISNISFKCALAFSDKNGINITINIKNEAGEVVASRDVVYSASEAAKYDIKEVSWTLDEAVTGNFVIEIVNNCPSATDGNKDRTAIWDLTWINA